ncbi:MAG: LLM class flavin-dependent oxidoreductase [Pigmentiphaga sp.]|uniref:LLM class flavin-dependent oxidoreductase n=1 Tax=Pigmentiphaga sp. TaxID=1977564 RepID=UPI0029A6DF8E|nr:LLM class flavin-dependent oxidoreductase [Pigmentiphaga sp.]MDX3907975.1 LLM class flavin-dependent oxidoreductase [Pigmentiphaga sp.]
MKTWFFNECPYPYLPDPASYESIRVTLPNGHYDPRIGADLYHMYLDLWLEAEDLGLDLMLNEHHQTPTCTVPAVPLMLSILARQTSRARLLVLGNPLANRNQPVRVAEEMAMIDVLSRGRLECGFVRGVPYEASAANISAFRGSQRVWEAHDLILKAWTTHDGPFNFEGRFYTHRQVNIWPRPWQQPHPPVWITVGSGPSTTPVAKRGHVGAVFLAGYQNIRKIFDGYRQAYLDAHGKPAPLDRLAYCALVFVGDNEAQAREGAEKLLWYMNTSKGAPQFSNPPGYHPPAVAAQFLKPQAGEATPITVEDQMARGNLFAGTPDQVFDQIKAFWEYSGGFGHFLMMGHAGLMTREETLGSMTRFAQEVQPRLVELAAGYDESEMRARREASPDRRFADTGGMARDFVR